MSTGGTSDFKNFFGIDDNHIELFFFPVLLLTKCNPFKQSQ